MSEMKLIGAAAQTKCPAPCPLLPFDLSHFAQQVAHFVTVEFCNRGDAVDIPDKVFGRTQKCFERRLTIAAAKNVAVWCDYHFDQSGRSPVFTEQASENSLEVIADLHDPEPAGAVLPYPIGFTDGDVVGSHFAPSQAKPLPSK